MVRCGAEARRKCRRRATHSRCCCWGRSGRIRAGTTPGSLVRLYLPILSLQRARHVLLQSPSLTIKSRSSSPLVSLVRRRLHPHRRLSASPRTTSLARGPPPSPGPPNHFVDWRREDRAGNRLLEGAQRGLLGQRLVTSRSTRESACLCVWGGPFRSW